MTTWRNGFAALALLSALGAAACSKSVASDNPPAGRATPTSTGPRMVKLDVDSLKRLGVHVEGAGGATAHRTLRVPGTLDYNFEHYAEIGVPLEGRVSAVNVRVGDSVKKGTVLASVVVPSIAAAQADYLTAQAGASAAKKNHAREEELLTKQLTTAREAEVAKSEADQADANLAAAEARLRALRVTVPKNDTVVAAAGTLTLTSPIQGVVVVRKANLGAFLSPAERAFVVADLTELWASLEVHESDVSYLHLGAEVELTVDAQPRPDLHREALARRSAGRDGLARRPRARLGPQPRGHPAPGPLRARADPAPPRQRRRALGPELRRAAAGRGGRRVHRTRSRGLRDPSGEDRAAHRGPDRDHRRPEQR